MPRPIWDLKKKKISDLKVLSKNPRQITKESEKELSRSLSKFGLCEPIVINRDGSVIGGHQRLNLLKKRKLDEVDVMIPDRVLEKKEVEELNIRLNKNTGSFDIDILNKQWERDDLIDWGFTTDELGGDIEDILSGGEEKDNEVLEPVSDPVTVKGDLYELGCHRLLCGDSTDPDDVTKLLDGDTPILMVTDAPYGVEYDATWRDGKGKYSDPKMRGKVQNDNQINWALAWSLFPGEVAYVWHAGKHCSEVQKSLEEAEYDIISQIVWVKQHFALSRGDYHWQHEPCWYAVRKGCQHNWQGSRKEATIWEISNLNPMGGSKDEDDRTSHSTQKPLECMSKPIRNNTARGEGVYDPFVGSGTTLIAADRLGRKSYCMELDPAYCDMVVGRWVKEQQKNGKEEQFKKNGEPIEWEDDRASA